MFWPRSNGAKHANAPGMNLLHYELTDQIIGVFYDVYNETGSGFLEQVVQTALVIALRSAGLTVLEHASYPVFFRGEIIGDFHPDVVVNNKVLIEVKSESVITARDEAQAINYLRVSDLEVALILNFGPKPQVVRRVLSNERKSHRGARTPIDSKIVKA
jgi:GxxExxY protein